jgi:hypothetical protein
LAIHRHLARKGAIRDFGHVHGFDARLQSERLVLRHEHLGSDHVALHDREHERAAGRVGLHQAADIHIALGNDFPSEQ